MGGVGEALELGRAIVLERGGPQRVVVSPLRGWWGIARPGPRGSRPWLLAFAPPGLAGDCASRSQGLTPLAISWRRFAAQRSGAVCCPAVGSARIAARPSR